MRAQNNVQEKKSTKTSSETHLALKNAKTGEREKQIILVTKQDQKIQSGGTFPAINQPTKKPVRKKKTSLKTDSPSTAGQKKME